MISSILSRLVILVFGTLYPAYASYKAVRTKNLKEYVKWMMYWIVFALFTCTETVTDLFLSWFPFYYEVKIIIVLWLLSPATKGSSILYRKFVHPALCRREQEIDEYIAKAKDQGYHTVLNLGTKGVNYATTVIMQTAIKGGGGLVQQIKKSYSLSDLTETEHIERDEADDVMAEPQVIRRNVARSGYNTRRSASESNTRSAIYFSELDVDVRGRGVRGDEPDYSHIKSTEDISSGYSSADNSVSLARTGSIGAGTRARVKQTRAAVTSIKRPQAAEGSEVVIEELQDDEPLDYTNMPPLMNIPSHLYLSHTDPPFIYQYVGDEIRVVQILKDPLNPNIIESPGISGDKSGKDDANVTNIPTVVADVLADIPSCNKDNEVIMTDSTTDNNKGPYSEGAKIDNCNASFSSNVDIESITKEECVTLDENVPKDFDNNIETTSADVSANDSVESDDEASFGTPDDSPKTKRKSPKGRYGKGKAPPPPNISDKPTVTLTKPEQEKESENLLELIKTLPNTSFKETGSIKSTVVNPISEKKRRHKSKSPKRMPKANTSGIGKLLQLPGKLAFWNKKDTNKDVASNSSDDSPRSSIIEQNDNQDHFQSLTDIYDSVSTKSDDQISFKDASDYETESISHEITEKSDALQKLIEAKIESHPEYNYKNPNEELPTMSKSTDV